MPTAGYVAMALGVVFSLVIGCGLMALLFYSSRPVTTNRRNPMTIAPANADPRADQSHE